MTGEFPIGARLVRAEPVVETLPGWMSDIGGCRRPEDLPKAALDYIRCVEKMVGCPIRYVSVGPERDQYFVME